MDQTSLLRPPGSSLLGVVQFISHVWLFSTPRTSACQPILSFPVSWILLKPMSTESVMPSNPLILCCPFSSCPQSFPAPGSFPMSHFTSGGQSIGASPSASILPVNIQGWFPLGLTGLIAFLSKGPSRLLQLQSLKASILQHSAFFMVQLSHPYITNEKNHSFEYMDHRHWSDVSAA